MKIYRIQLLFLTLLFVGLSKQIGAGEKNEQMQGSSGEGKKEGESMKYSEKVQALYKGKEGTQNRAFTTSSIDVPMEISISTTSDNLDLLDSIQAKLNQIFKSIFDTSKGQDLQDRGKLEKKLQKFDGFLQDYLDSSMLSFKERVVKKGQAAWKKTKELGSKVKELAQDNPGKTVAVAATVGGLAAGGYYFRKGIGQNVGKVGEYAGKAWNMTKDKAGSAWGKVKGKFKR